MVNLMVKIMELGIKSMFLTLFFCFKFTNTFSFFEFNNIKSFDLLVFYAFLMARNISLLPGGPSSFSTINPTCFIFFLMIPLAA